MVNPITDAELKRLEELHAAATAGDWQRHPSPKKWVLLPIPEDADPNNDANANWCVAAHNAYPALRARIAELEARAVDMEKSAKDWQAGSVYQQALPNHQVAKAFESFAERDTQHAADLRAAAQAVRAMEWRPISEAPRDGTPLILARGTRVTPGFWSPESEAEERHYWDMDGNYTGSVLEGFSHPALWMSDDGGFTEEEPPTHYLPLPAPPEAAR